MKLKAKILTLVLALAMLFSVIGAFAISASAATYDYYVAGDSSTIGANWSANNSDNGMTKLNDSSQVYQKVYTNVPAGTYQFKVTDGSWTNSWGKDGGSSNYSFTVTESGTTVIIGFDSSSKKPDVYFVSPSFDTEKTSVVYLKNAAGWTGDMYAHSWSISGGTNWNGNKMTLVDSVNKIYKIEVAVGQHMIIFNNNSKQTSNLTIPTNQCSIYNNSTNTWSEYHSWVDADCDSPKTCSACGLTDGEPNGHTGGSATCAAKAICTTCGESYGDLASHTEETVPGTAATCTSTGLTDGVKCSVCGETLTAQEEIAKKDHDFNKGSCTVCGEPDPDYVPPIVLSVPDGLDPVEMGEGNVLPEANAPDGYTFVGWSESTIDETIDMPEILNVGDKYEGSNKVLYALYTRTEEIAGSNVFEKVTANLSDFSGTYLIVYENGSVAFNGALTKDGANNYVSVTITNNTIEYNDEIAKAVFTLTKSDTTYSILGTSNYYIGTNSDSNEVKYSTSTQYLNTITIDSDGNADIAGSSGAHLRFNDSSNNMRFRYYKSSSYTGQKAIQLYKLVTSAGSSTTYYCTLSTYTCEHSNTATTRVEAGKGTSGSVTVKCLDCGEQISHEIIPALNCEVTFVVPEGVDAPVVDDCITVTLPAGPALTSHYNSQSYVFAGWAKVEVNTATSDKPTMYSAGETVDLTGDATFYAVYSFSVEDPSSQSYKLTDISKITASDVFIIARIDENKIYAMSNDKGTEDAPSAVLVTSDGNIVTNEVEDNIKWNLGGSAGAYIFYPNGDSSKWLYTTATNNGLRVGTNENKTYTIESNYLKHNSTGRYVGVYNNQDWRNYTSINSNIEGQTFGFYVLKSDTVTYYTTAPHGHTYTATETTPATCEGTGVKTYTCTCGDSYTEVIPALGHEYGDLAVEVSATCISDGMSAHYLCSECGKYFDNDKNATTAEALKLAATGVHNYVDGECSVCEIADPDDTITIFFENNWLWSDIHVYYWSGTDDVPNAAWPGEEMTDIVGKNGDYDIYQITIPRKIDGFIISGIKNDGSNYRDQTPDITEGWKNCICYYMVWNDANDVGTYDYHIPEADDGNCVSDILCSNCGTVTTEGNESHTPGAAATCTTDQVCTVCNTVITKKLGHDYDDGWTQHPTENKHYHACNNGCGSMGSSTDCVDEDSKDHECDVCNKILSEHNYKSTVTKAATCLEAGVMTYNCEYCGASYTEEISATGHQNTTTTTVDATCTVDGSTTVTCDDCGATVSTTVIPATGHQNTTTTTVKATCTVDGSTTVTCNDCDATVSTDVIPATGHQNTTTTTVDATCTVDGSTTVTCNDCDATVSTTVITATGHNMQKTADEVAPGCESVGYTAVYTCANGCGKTEGGVEIPATNHDYESAWTKHPTENQHYHVCKNGCGSMGNLTDCYEEDSVDHYCDICSKKISDHTYSSSITTSATCTSAGERTFTCACGDNYTEEISAKGHAYGEVTYVWNSDNTYCTATKVCANDNAHVVTEKVATSSERTVEPDCITTGTDVYTATFSSELGGVITKTVTVDALGHNYGDATCTEDAICSRCGEKSEKAIGHVFGEWTDNGANHIRECERDNCGYVDSGDHSFENGSCTVCNRGGLAGAGTESDPYLINNLAELIWFRDSVNTYQSDGSNQYKGKYVKLNADIDLNGVEWTPIGTNSVGDHAAFLGTFDGNGHTISNLYINSDGDHLGFFARVGSYAEGITPTVKNITFNNVDVSSNSTSSHAGSYVAGVIANAGGNSVVSNVKVTGDLYVEGYGYIGGIVGHGYPDIDNCVVDVNDGSYIYSHYWCVGGIIGYAGEGGTPIVNSSVSGVDIWSALGGAGAVAGILQDGNRLENVSASNVEITSDSDYCMGYIAGNGECSTMTNVTVSNVIATAKGNEISSTDAVAKIISANGGAATFSVASVNGTICFSLQDAVDLAQPGDTVVLLRDVELSGTVVVAKELTINLNGKTITSAADWPADDKSNEALICAARGSKLTINDSVGGGVLDATASNLKVAINLTKYQEADGELAELIINAGTIKGNWYAVAGNGSRDNTKLTINGGKLIGVTYAGIYHPQNGTLTVTGGEIEGNTNGIYLVSGNLYISGGSLVGNNDSALGIVNKNNGGYQAVGTVEITGGSFTTAANTDVITSTAEAGERKTKFISGGQFGTDFALDLLASGLALTKNGEYYGIVDAIAEIDGNGYATLQEAINAAKSGDTVKLLCDIELDAPITIDKSVTIDATGKNIVSTAINAIQINNVNVAEITINVNSITNTNSTAPKSAVITITNSTYVELNVNATFIAAAERTRTGSSATVNKKYILSSANVSNVSATINSELVLANNEIFNGDPDGISAFFKADYADELALRGYVTQAAGEGMVEVIDSVPYYIGSNGNWWLGDVDTGVPATGPQGPQGPAGAGIVGIVLDESRSTKTQSIYVVTLSNETTYDIIVNHGKDGEDGDDANVKFEIREDGCLYVSYDGGVNFTKLDKVVGEDGISITGVELSGRNLIVRFSDGRYTTLENVVGEDGKTPEFKIENGKLSYSYDNGNTWSEPVNIKGEQGEPGAAGTIVNIETSDLTDDEGNKIGTLVTIYLDNNEYKSFEILDGKDGKDANVLFDIDEATGNLLVSYDGGEHWSDLGKVVGENGADGKGIAGIEIDENNYLVITYTEGEPEKFGPIKGADGENGDDAFVEFKVENGYIYVRYTENGEWGEPLAYIKGEPGKDANVKFEVRNDGYLWVSYDGGENFTKLDKVVGENGADGKGIAGIEIDENNYLVITYTEGEPEKFGPIKGADGENGDDAFVEFKVENGYIYVRYSENGEWGEPLAYIKGEDGKDAVKPLFKVENGNLHVSYDNGITWDDLGEVQGPQGETGLTGKPGADGNDGQDGQDGLGIKEIVIEDDGDLAITYTDGKVVTIGNVMGQPGLNGMDGVTPKFKIEENILCVSYDEGETWTELVYVKGDTGETGPEGPQGETGKDGNDNNKIVIICIGIATLCLITTIVAVTTKRFRRPWWILC